MVIFTVPFKFQKKNPKFHRAPFIFFYRSSHFMLQSDLPGFNCQGEVTHDQNNNLNPKQKHSSGNFRRIFNYYVGEEIDQGSFSTIRLAFHNTTLRPCALKMISKTKLRNAGQIGQSILFAESVISPLLKHPNIAKTIECVETKRSILVFMELCTDGNLCDVVRDLNFSQKVEVATQIISAVKYLHSHSICHRDIKMDNILIHRGTAKLCDFGFSTFCIGENSKISGVCGSYEYVAPEVMTESEYNGMAADIWSLGILLYKLFSHQAPEISTIDLEMVPPDIQTILRKIFIHDPASRITINELFEEFQKIKCHISNEDETQGNNQTRKHNSSNKIHKKEKSIHFTNASDSFNDNSLMQKEDVISRLCEALNRERSAIMQDLKDPKLNKTQILAKLINEYPENVKMTRSKFQKSQRANSVPQLSNFDYQSLMEQNDDVFMQLGDKTFHDKSICQIFKALKTILFKYNFCVCTKPNETNTVVILNTEEGDVKLQMNCVTLNDDGCRMTLSAPPQFVSTAKEVFSELDFI
ncbi:hypothetical protein TRFO_11644 [Tritrichomonas foetus]|uniref:Protein kinase domain-containing protein n=1 Tax=Tritrichomonas foetus TaxID=1144522 RepID=A0A1J4J660_9EUKA|nr:hypothetical protein TRFO_11644 [Tritrichomonas foetus]|eukprot:OHS93647.1 hypothetical protein TRFO_11644 [Tritrichomonas foetus]